MGFELTESAPAFTALAGFFAAGAGGDFLGGVVTAGTRGFACTLALRGAADFAGAGLRAAGLRAFAFAAFLGAIRFSALKKEAAIIQTDLCLYSGAKGRQRDRARWP
jgi:hypothetical protein